MYINTKELKDACTKILVGMDNTSTSGFVGRLELKTSNSNLFLNVTNAEYFVEVLLGQCSEDFHATVSADVFLKLIAQLTTDTIEVKIKDNSLLLNANGKYKLPLIFDDMEILNLPKIEIYNPTINFNIKGDILNSILVNNSKEIAKIQKDASKSSVRPIQKMYYVDEQGAITFFRGACVNKFTLEKPVKMLLNANLVRLFSLFKGMDVDFTLGYDSISDEIIQTKVQFKTQDICVTAILNCDDTLLKQMPVSPIRNRAYNEFPNVITVNRVELLSAIQRLTLFTSDILVGTYKTGGKLTFTPSELTITDYPGENSETLKYANQVSETLNYSSLIDLIDIKMALESTKDQYVSIGFGDHQAMVLAKNNIYTVIPEMTIEQEGI